MGKNFDYRKYYKEYYGIEFGSEYDVHHIDFNRGNNDISNLILLPKKLHRKYHFYLEAIGAKRGIVNDISFRLDSIEYISPHNMAYKMLIKLFEIQKELNYWVNDKEMMDRNIFYDNQLKEDSICQ